MKKSEINQSEEKFRLLFEKSVEPILLIDGYNFIECNEATVKKLKYKSKEELYNVHPSVLSPERQPDGKLSIEKAKEMMDIAYRNGYHRFEWVHSDKYGKEYIMDISLTKIPHKGKDMLFTTWRDITQQKEFEAQILNREKQYSTLFEQAADGILVGIANGEIINANESICKLTGYDKNELIGNNIKILFENTELDKKPLRYDLVKKGDTVIRERNIVRKDGKVIPIEMNTKILDDGRMQALFRDLSKRKEAELDAKKNRKLLEKAEGVARLGRYFYDVVNDRWDSSEILNEIFGIDSDYKKNFRNWLNIIHPDYKREMLKYFKENILKRREKFDKVYKIIRISDNTERWVHGFGDSEFDENKNPLSVFGVIQDITEQKNVEIALKSSEERYRNIFLNSPLGILHYDKSGRIIDCNGHFVEIIGSNKNVLVGLNMLKDITNEKIKECVKTSLHKGEAYYEDWYTSVTGNKSTYVRILFKGITDDKGEIISGLGLVEDITERKKAEQNLKVSEEKFKSLATLLPEVIYETDDKGNLTFVNLRAFEIFEYTPEDFKKGINIFNVIAPQDIEKASKNFKKVLSGNVSKGDKYIALTKTGRQFPILIYSDIVKQGNKNIGLRGIIVNISDIEQAQEEIRKSEEKFRLLFESSQDAIFITDNKKLIECNLQTLKIFGFDTKDEIINKSTVDFSPEFQPDGSSSKDKFEKLTNEAYEGKKQIFEWVHKRKNGSNFYTEVNLIPFMVDNKQYIQSIVRDISERKEIEQKIYNAVIETEEKERQRLASDIHDEIGPLLSSLKMYIESLNQTKDVDKQSYIKDKLQSLIKESITNVREVSNALSPYLLSKYGLNVALRSFLNASNELIDIDFKINFENKRFPINVETVFYRVTKELYNNTIKHARANKIKTSLIYENKSLVLTYEDNGIGINKEDIKELEQKGMGLYNITNRIKSINGNYKFFDDSKGFKFQITKQINNIK